jgi:hypothetical protein
MPERKRETDGDPRDRKAPQGIVRDERGQEQPADKERARQVSRKDRGDDPPGEKDLDRR